MGSSTVITLVKPGDRIDIMAARLLGNVNKWQELVDANPHLDIFNPKPGQQVVVPDAE